MINYLVRLAKRFAVLIPGIVIAYISVRDIFPFFDKGLPGAVAIFFTYVLGAYVLIPALIRLIRIFLPARHLPLYCITPDGFASDPLNVGVIGSRSELIATMEAAGWHTADPNTIKNMAREGICGVLNRSYPNAPMSRLYLFGRKQDIAFEIPIEGERGNRHHVRFWATTYRNDTPLRLDSIQLHDRKSQRHGSDLLWLGAASRDIGFALIKHNVQVTHMIAPDTNAERDLIIGGLQATKRVATIESIRFGQPYKLRNRALRGQLHSDGVVTIAKLKNTTY